MKQIELLQPSVKHIKHQIRNIIGSYSHPWDIIAEITQNSVDAIRQTKTKSGRIEIAIDAPSRTIVIEDNGIGIDPKILAELLSPFSTTKQDQKDLIGEKGDGLSFVVFSSQKVTIKTSHGNETIEAVIDEPYLWLKSNSEDFPSAELSEIQQNIGKSGTTISVKLPEETQNEENDIFSLDINQLEFILRTKTAIGDTRFIWSSKDNSKISYSLVFTDVNGEKHEIDGDSKFMLPIEKMHKNLILDYEDYVKWESSGIRSENERRAKINGKLIYHSGETTIGARKVKFWSAFAQNRRYWIDTVSKNFGLVPKNTDSDDLNENYLYSGGIYPCTKRMPTGMRLSPRAKGEASYLPLFYIIIEDDALHFDIGRKSIPHQQQIAFTKISDSEFNLYIKNFRRYLSKNNSTSDDDFGEEEDINFDEIESLPKLNSEISRFVKRPNHQEAMVVAIFFELIGKDKFPKLKPYITGYGSQYDLYGKYGKKNVVLEFKYELKGLLNDFDDLNKMFDDIDILVLWDISEKDFELAQKKGLNLIDKKENTVPGDSKIDFSYHLELYSSQPIRIICVKDHI